MASRQFLCHLTYVKRHVCRVPEVFKFQASSAIQVALLSPFAFCGCLLLVMGYIPEHALNNLKKYSYKGVDKYVY